MSARVQIAPGHWLYEPAAASWARMRDAGMPAGGITEAGRTRARQEYLYAQYLAGRLVAYAARPGTSKHESGRAVDMQTTSKAHSWLIAHGRAHGWMRPLLHAAKPEPWHWEYSIEIDQHLTSAVTPVTPIAPAGPTWEDDDMALSPEALAQIKREAHDAVIGVLRSDEARAIIRDAVLTARLDQGVGSVGEAIRDARVISRRTEQAVDRLARPDA